MWEGRMFLLLFAFLLFIFRRFYQFFANTTSFDLLNAPASREKDVDSTYLVDWFVVEIIYLKYL
jgi:hypothetical protein